VSRSVDLFISSGEPLAQLAQLIAARTGLAVRPDPAVSAGAAAYELSAGDLIAELAAHPYLDDDDLPLSRYEYALSLRTTAPGHLGASPEVGLLRRVAAELDDRAVLLVLDLQNRASTAFPSVDGDAGEDPS